MATRGKQISFVLDKETKSTGVYMKPRDIIYIPENWEDSEYLRDLIEMDSDGNPLTGIQEIRYIPSLQSVFVANQPEGAVVEALKFTHKNSINDKRQANLVKFLRLTDKNSSNPNRDTSKGSMFHELVPENVAQKELDLNQLRYEAESIVFNEPTEKLYPMANVYEIPIEDPLQMKTALRRKAQENPQLFLDRYNSPDMPILERIVVAGNLGIWKQQGRRIVWQDGTPLTTLPPSVDAHEYMLTLAKDNDYQEDILGTIDRAIEKTLA